MTVRAIRRIGLFGIPAVLVWVALPSMAQQPCRGAGYIDGIVAESTVVERVTTAEAAIQREGAELELMNGAPICFGDAIVTSTRITVRLRIAGVNAEEHECTVGPGTRVELTAPESLFLRVGRIFMALRGRFDVVTSFARLGARGTEFQVEVTDSGVDVVQIEGSLEVVSQSASSKPGGPVSPGGRIRFPNGGLGSGFRPALFPAPQRAPALLVDRMTRLSLRRGESPRITGADEALFRRVVDRDSQVYAATRPDLLSVNAVRTFETKEQRTEAYRVARLRALWDPANAESHEQLGHAYADWADPRKAIRSYDKSSARERRGRELALFYNNRGNAHRFNGDPRQAEVYYRRALQADPKFAFPYNGLGDLFRERAAAEFEQGDAETARRLLRSAREHYQKSLDPALWGKEGGHNRAVPVYNLGDTFLLEAENSRLSAGERMRHLREAEEQFRRAAAEDPGYAFPQVGIGRVYATRARSYREQNRRDEEARQIELGQAHARAVAERYPAFAPARVQAGEMLELAGDDRRAAAEFLAATRADPGYAGAYHRAGAALEKLGMNHEALGYFQTYLHVERRDLLKTRRARDVTSRIQKLALKPPEPIVPSVIGKTQQDAKLALEGAGLRVGRVVAETNDAPKGTVLQQQPEPSAAVSANAEVTLVVSSGPALVNVPQVTGSPLAQARTTLERAGLRFEIIFQPSSHALPGSIVAQSPRAGAQVRQGSPVQLTVVGAPRLIKVPNVVGLPLNRARITLSEAGLRAGEVAARRDRAQAGTVLAQDPAAGSTAEPGAGVGLVVSAEAERVAVPKLVGLSLERARAAVAQAGLRVGEIAQRRDRARPGTVLAQDPSAGVPIERGAAIRLLIAGGPKTVVVPGVERMHVERASAVLRAAGFSVRIARQRSSLREGTVLKQTPPAGVHVEAGTEVTLLVATHQPPK
jgi:beta-lactam-binding protein with PASTA domain/tetratricopeptide (TPR) repeat protein